MKKLIKSKKGFTDILIGATILGIFFFTAILITPISEGLNANVDTFDTDNLDQNIKNNAESISVFSVGTLLISMLKLGLWDVGNTLGLNFIVDAFYTFLGIILFFIVVRTVRGVG